MSHTNGRKRKIENKIIKEVLINSDSDNDIFNVTPTKTISEFDLSNDIFDTTAETTVNKEIFSSPESSKSSLKGKNNLKPNTRILKPSTLALNSTESVGKVQQTKMDLFVKWKDPKKLGKAERAREKIFRGASNPDIHDSSWTVPKEEIENKFEQLPAKKKTIPKVKKEKECPKSLTKPLDIKTSPVRLSQAQEGIDETDSDDIELERQLMERRKKMKQVMKGNKSKEKGGLLDKVQKGNQSKLKDGHVIRKQEDRQRMHATDCPCCKEYYDMLQLSPESRQKRIQQSSRHRYVNLPKPKTPDHYWNLKFDSPKNKKMLSDDETKKKSVSKKLF